jgi:hypothetical protein
MKVRSRFSYFRDKLQVFFLGLLFGLVLGGGFFVLKLDQYVKELSFYKSLTQKDDKTAEMLPEVKPETENPKPKKVKKETASYDTSSAGNSNAPMDYDTSTVATDHSNSNDIVVIKDEQMAAKTYSIINLEQKRADSIPTKETSTGSLAVEFWKSPLNYHGYKFNRNKLVLFGYGDQDLVAVFKVDNTTVLKCLTGTFRIEPTTEFHVLDRITDESTLKRINETDISKIPGNRE